MDEEAERPIEKDKKELRRRLNWSRAVKVSLGVVGGLSLFMGYISATGMRDAERDAAARKAIDDFFAALNARDREAAKKLLHCPHIQLVGSEVRIWNSESEIDTYFDALLEGAQWTYRLDSCVTRQSSEDKVHFEVRFSRFEPDGSRRVFQSLWVVTRKDDNWGIQSRSSIMM